MSIITCFPSSSSLVNSPLFKELLSDIHCISKSSLGVFTSTSDVFVSWTQPESPSPTLQFVATCFTYRANHNLLHSHKKVDRCLFPLKDRDMPLCKRINKESFKLYFKWKPQFAPNLVVTNPNTNQMESESKNHYVNQSRSHVYVQKKRPSSKKRYEKPCLCDYITKISRWKISLDIVHIDKGVM